MDRRNPMFHAIVVSLVLLGMAACGDNVTVVEVPAIEFETSFEDDEAGFQSDATDLGDPWVAWSVERSTELADDGDASMRLEIGNDSDQPKVWIEKDFDGLEGNSLYDVVVVFDFASTDVGTAGNWVLFVDADPDSPDDWSDLVNDAVLEDTGNEASEDAGYLWLDKSVPLRVETDAKGTVHIAIGVWGTSAGTRAYFIDDVQVTATKIG